MAFLEYLNITRKKGKENHVAHLTVIFVVLAH